MPIKQDNRSLAIKTALGPDVLAVRSISVREEISRLFQIEAELSSENAEVDFDQVIGKEVTIRLDVAAKEKRYFAGIVSRLVQVANQDGYAHYRATIVPWLWLLTRTSDCRIFLDKTVPQILEEVFNDHDRKDYQLKLSGNYEKKEYCVQYRETDFNFISRLMEQEGIYYYFEHKDGKHTMVLADAISAHKPFKGYEEIAYHELDKSAPNREVVTGWTMEKEVQPVAYALNDFDFKKPKTPLKASSSVTRKYGMAQTEIYDYPGEYFEHGDGERLAEVRLNELQSQYELLHGQATARGLATGCIFKLKYHPRGDQNRDYLITSTMMEIDAGEFSTGGTAGGGEFFSCNFTAIEKAQQFRPARVSPKPIVQGPQTAIVVGQAGEEIHTDEHARVKVQFHWDRYGKFDENSSFWVRVSHANAGKGWGSMITPRIGQEVIVEFLEGDPDRPIITGRVYNGEQKPPYAGGQGVVSGLKSNTHKGKGYNEMSMDDTAKNEKITIHAQYDMSTTVEHDATHTVVTGKFTEKIKSDTSITIETGKYEHKVDTGTADYKVQGALTENYNTSQATTVKGNIDIKSSKEILIEAAEKITLHTGLSTITMVKDGSISITGKKITIIGDDEVKASGNKLEATGKSEAKLGTGSQNITTNVSKTALSGAAINSSAVGMHEISGAVVKIN